MPPLPIVPDFDKREELATRRGGVANTPSMSSSFVSVAKKLSTTALSQQSPTRLMLGVKPVPQHR
jgi:hypothetical protein